MTQALILVGGQGTRLRPLTCNTPKSMVPVLNIPFLEHVLRNLREHGIEDIIFAQHHLAAPMLRHFGNGERFGVRLTYVIEDSPLGTAGAVKNAEKSLSDTFLVLNGDVFHNRDFTQLMKIHRERKAQATIVLTPVEDPTIYGLVETESNGRVKRFLEKPKPAEITTNMINAGTYVLEPGVLSRIPPGVKYSVEKELFPRMISDGLPVYAHNSDNYWMDVGTPEKYLQLHRDLLAGRCDGYTFSADVTAGKTSRIHRGTRVSGKVVIGEGCEVETGSVLTGPLVMGDRCQVGEGVVITGSVIWDDVTIHARSVLHNCAVANNSIIGQGSELAEVIIGDHVTVPPGARLKDTRIFPEGES